MSPFEHQQNLKNLEGSFHVEGIALSEETRNSLDLLGADKISSDELLRQIITKYKAAGT